MRILITTDTFPPMSGGSGWSTYELANGLRARGHELIIVQPYSGKPPEPFDGFDVGGFHVAAPAVPFVRNYFRNERLYARFAEHLQPIIRERRVDLVHAQHELTGPASVRAARSAGIPCICTVRDYWPVCYWNDLMIDPVAGEVCPACSSRGMTQCLQPRVGRAWPLTLPLIPYMRSNLDLKQRDLADADAIVAVSRYTAAALRGRSPHLAERRIEVLPNGVDIARVREHVRNSARPLEEPYALFVGKLALNKGIGALIDVVRRASLRMPLVIVGDGPEREALVEAAARAETDVRMLRWLDRDDVFRWLGHAAFLIFPSNWPEPLSRVLIEASALCVPIVAMNTGGTPDVIVHGETGLLSSSAEELAEHVSRIASDAELRKRLGTAAGKRAQTHFDIAIVLDRFEALYRDVLAVSNARRGSGAA
jgi:glycosyltransferase involved in cell wall biosynthesis